MSRKVAVVTSVFVAVQLFGATATNAANKIINISGTGTDAQYIEDGKTKQLNVVITVGDTVIWRNAAGNKNHTATSDVKDSQGQVLFDIALNAGPGDSGSKLFDQAAYDAAVAATHSAAGGRVFIGYYCAKHPTLMGAKLVLQPANLKDPNEHE